MFVDFVFEFGRVGGGRFAARPSLLLFHVVGAFHFAHHHRLALLSALLRHDVSCRWTGEEENGRFRPEKARAGTKKTEAGVTTTT